MKDAGFGKLVEIAKSVNLATHLKGDFVKLQYQEPFDPKPYLLDELILRLDGDGKLSALPEKAFERIMNYRAKQLNFASEDTSILTKKDGQLTEQEKLTIYLKTIEQSDTINKLPNLIANQIRQYENNVHENIKQFLRTLESNIIQQLKNELPYYVDLLSKIEKNNHTPNADELAKLDLLHDELVRHNRLDALPNRAQAFLENHQTQQEIRQQLPSKPNIQELLRKMKGQQEVKPMEMVYLQFYLNKHITKLDTGTKEAIFKAFQNYPDLYQAAREQVELIDSDMLEILKRLVGKIEREQYRFTAEAEAVIFETEEYGKHIIQTTTQGEPRFKNEAQDKTKLAVIKLLENGAYVDDGFLEQIRTHWASDIVQLPKDYHGNDANDGSVYYAPDERMGSDITAYIAWVTQNAKNEYRLYIIETNPKIGIMLSIYDHLISLDESLKGLREYPNYPLYGKTKIGSHRKNNGSNEHGHLEKLFMPYETEAAQAVFTETDTTAMREKIKTHIRNFNANKTVYIDDMQSPTFKVIETWRNHPSDDITIISLFTPGTQLYNQYFREVDQIMREDTQSLQMNLIAPTLYAFTRGRDISGDKKQTVDDYLKGLNEAEQMWKILNLPSISNQQQLEALITILTRVKLLLAQVGETNSRLDTLIQQTHDANIKLREKIFQSNSKLEQTLQHINNQLQ